MNDKLDLARLLRDGSYRNKPDVFSTIDQFPTFPREVYLFGKYNPQEVGERIDFDAMNNRSIHSIRSLGLQVARLPVREGTSEEMRDAKGKHLESGEILLARRYYRPGSESWENAESYDQEFLRDHHGNYPKEWEKDHLARLTHIAEDIVLHEYGHRVWKENYLCKVVEEVAKSVLDDGRRDPTYSNILAKIYASDTEEAFARWLNYAVAGHEHPADIADLVLFSSEEIRSKGQRTYNDRKAVADFYKLLIKTSVEHSVQYVVQNLPAITLDFIRVKHERKEAERAAQAAEFAKMFEGLIAPIV